jgi:hypothetical protein
MPDAEKPRTLIERPKRAKIWAVSWALLAVAALAGAYLAGQQESADLQRETRAAQERAESQAEGLLAGAVTAKTVAAPVLGDEHRALTAELEAGILGDEDVARVRLWDPGRELMYSSERRGEIGLFVAKGNQGIEAALKGEIAHKVTLTPFSAEVGVAGEELEMLRTYVPIPASDGLGIGGVLQIDRFFAPVREAASSPWRTLELVALAVAAVCAVMTAYTFLRSARPVLDPAVAAELGLSEKEARKLAVAEAKAEKLREQLDQLEQKHGVEDKGVKALEERLAASEDELSTTRAQLHEAQERVRALEEQLTQARAGLEFAQAERARAEAQRQVGTIEGADEPIDTNQRIVELEEALRRSERERAMLRAGRPETIQEARIRELEDQLADALERVRVAEGPGAGNGQATRVDRRRPGRPQRPVTASTDEGAEMRSLLERFAVGEEASDDQEPVVDPGEMRSKLSRATERKRPPADG